MNNKIIGRNLSLDLVKIIAMFMVLALHININNKLPISFFLTLNYCFACIAIPLFFMVSGYLLANKELNVNYFGSILCMLYAICVFSACINIKIDGNNKIIPKLSSLFLPVYAIHPTLYSCLGLFIPKLEINGNMFYIITLFIFVMATILICEIITKLPYESKIFRI
jgi:surface polysaccharide O-acyltransferase-like enzyme